MHIYDRLGVRRRINAAGPQTRLGGAPLSPEVLAAMSEAAESSVDMAELQSAASEIIAQKTGAEAGIVTSGATAALTLAASACLTGFDPAKMDLLPNTDCMPNEIIISRMHRISYDHAIRASGAKLIEVGFNDLAAGCGVRGVDAWEFEAAIGPRTVGIAYAASPRIGIALTDVVTVAEAHKLPVIVDAAAQLPPVENLRRFIGDGASLVAFSGGKAIGGPQASGILCGRRELVAAALLQQLDMDINAGTWALKSNLIRPNEVRTLPHHGIGRGFKVGKEEIAGLVVALEHFTSARFQDDFNRWNRWLMDMQQRLEKISGLETSLSSKGPEAIANAVPVLELRFTDRDAAMVGRALKQGDPAIDFGEARLHEGTLLIKPVALKEGETDIIVEKLTKLMTTK